MVMTVDLPRGEGGTQDSRGGENTPTGRNNFGTWLVTHSNPRTDVPWKNSEETSTATQTLDQRVTPLFVELERIKKDNEIMRDALKESKIDLQVTELLQRDVDELSQLLYEAQKSLASTKEENNQLAIAP